MALSEKAARSFDNLKRSFAGLSDAVKAPITEERDVAGIIKCFELTYETSWRTLQKIAADQQLEAMSPKQALAAGFQLGLVEDEKAWLKIKDDRNDTVHTYNRAFAHAMVERIIKQHVAVFSRLIDKVAAF
jgi:nucleotidyltransferase substrate binding protein (TIGR01987 family)